MNWVILIGVITFMVVLFAVKRMSYVDAATVKQKLQNGAVVVDVRTPGEFQSGHLRGAVNLPVDELPRMVSRRFPDKSVVLLLHCASGVRSGTAQRQLIAAGYGNVFNMGSYNRAQRLVSQS
jgi:phage shock protein E